LVITYKVMGELVRHRGNATESFRSFGLVPTLR